MASDTSPPLMGEYGLQQNAIPKIGNTTTKYTLLVTQETERFITAFSNVCSTQFKSQISEKCHPDSIKLALDGVDLDKVLGREEAFKIVRQSYGLSSWIIAPESGVRGLLRATLQLYEEPLQKIVFDMHKVTLEATRLAMQKCGAKLRSSGLLSDNTPEEVVRHLLLSRAEDLVGTWRDQTWEQLRRNIHAETEFPAAERFATLKSRLQQLLGEEAARQAERQNEAYKKMLMDTLSRLQASEPVLNTKPQHVPVEEPPSWSEFYMGYLLKKSKRRGVWQRRWVVLSVRQGRLWYFRDPEEQPARAMAVLFNNATLITEHIPEDDQNTTFQIICRGLVEPIQVKQDIHADAHRTAALLTGKTTKLISSYLTLRAGSTSSKNQWCDMIKKSIEGVPERQKELKYQADNHGVITAITRRRTPNPTSIPITHTLPASFDHPRELTPLGRKISTKISKNDVDPPLEATNLRVGNNTNDHEDGVPHTEEQHHSDEEEENEEERLKKELDLFNEIVSQSKNLPISEDQAIIDCISLAVREYCCNYLSYLTQQASRIIADGMLPLNRAIELHTTLLRVLITSSESNCILVDDA